jgi:fatty acid desaturase
MSAVVFSSSPLLRHDVGVAAVDLDAVARRLVLDLHTPRPAIFWADLLFSAIVGWGAFAVALAAEPWSATMVGAAIASGFALYRGLCFTHELTHLRRGAIPAFEAVWNGLFGVPLLLPSFTYVGVHQSHHNLSTYGTIEDPEYLPFASSRTLIVSFALQACLLIPPVLLLRFLVLSPIGLVWPAFHRWLERHASSFSMNPAYRRVVPPAMAVRMWRWELVTLVLWIPLLAGVWVGRIPARGLWLWWGVLTFVSFFNTLRVLGAHEYETDGTPRDRQGQLHDSIDTPGGPWTELWAPVGLRYHALHHYFPGIPYHNLGVAYRRLMEALPAESPYQESTRTGIRHSLGELWAKARRGHAALTGGYGRRVGS